MWYWSVFIQYSYYRDLFCSWPVLRLCHRHCHVWVRYYNTMKITVWCMSSILIHMTYFSVYKIFISEHYREIVSYITTPGQQVSVKCWNITITVWLQSQVHRVTYYFVLIVFWCWTFVTLFFIHKFVHYTALILIFDFC